MESKINYTSLIIVVFIVGIVSAAGGYLLGVSQQKDKTTEIISSYQEELTAAKEVTDVMDVMETEFNAPQPEYRINGTIKNIKGNTIILEFEGFVEQDSPWTEPKEIGTKERKITISPETVLIDEQAREEEADESMSEEDPTEHLFSPEELKEGMFISVQAGVDIKTNEEFTATEIYLLER